MEQIPDHMDESDLTDADKAILDVLQEGRATRGMITEETGLHRNTVGNRLEVLRVGEAVRRVHAPTALYELVEDPRDE